MHWQRAGASVFGGGCPGSGNIGYHENDLNKTPFSFAELDMGTALGNLPYHTRVRVLNPSTGKRAWIIKADIGGGGGPVFGLHRSFDLYYPLAHWLAGASCTWTGVIDWRMETAGERQLHNERTTFDTSG